MPALEGFFGKTMAKGVVDALEKGESPQKVMARMAVARAATHSAIGAGVGALWTPDDPAVGAFIGGLFGGGHALLQKAHVTIARPEPDLSSIASDRLLPDHTQAPATATVRIEREPVSLRRERVAILGRDEFAGRGAVATRAEGWQGSTRSGACSRTRTRGGAGTGRGQRDAPASRFATRAHARSAARQRWARSRARRITTMGCWTGFVKTRASRSRARTRTPEADPLDASGGTRGRSARRRRPARKDPGDARERARGRGKREPPEVDSRHARTADAGTPAAPADAGDHSASGHPERARQHAAGAVAPRADEGRARTPLARARSQHRRADWTRQRARVYDGAASSGSGSEYGECCGSIMNGFKNVNDAHGHGSATRSYSEPPRRSGATRRACRISASVATNSSRSCPHDQGGRDPAAIEDDFGVRDFVGDKGSARVSISGGHGQTISRQIRRRTAREGSREIEAGYQGTRRRLRLRRASSTTSTSSRSGSSSRATPTSTASRRRSRA
jgi:hypothetical protein